MVICKFCYQETFCVFIYGERVYIVIQMNFIQIYFTFYDLGINLQIFVYFRSFADPTHEVKYKGKQNSEKIQNPI